MNKIFLSIGGSDNSAGAGIQADIKTSRDIGIHVATVLSCITAQNSKEVLDIYPVADEIFTKQIKSIVDDFEIQVIKTSMLVSIKQIDLVLELLDSLKGVVYICDPIMVSTTGATLISENVLQYAKSNLYSKADILIPNLDEALVLLGDKSLISRNIEFLAKEIKTKYGCEKVLLKGGHDYNKIVSLDHLYSDNLHYSIFTHRFLSNKKIRGTGCSFASAIAGFILLGFDINNSIILAKQYIAKAIKGSYKISNEASFIPKVNLLHDKQTFPRVVFDHSILDIKFKSLNKIGFYPIVDDYEKIPRLVRLGVKTIQLRIKSSDFKFIEQQVVQAIKYQNKYSLQLFINDHYKLAIKHKAFGVHIGHEDLLKLIECDRGSINEMLSFDMALGLSTHDYYELSVALGIQPSYIALGPIYETTTKQMKFGPQGLDRVSEWLSIIELPLVVIGGIKKEHLKAIANRKIDGVSVVSLIDEISDAEITEITKYLEK